MTIKFETGHTYKTRSPCDHDAVISISVVSRTAKTIKTACGKTLRVAEYEGRETVKPWGSYSMAPIITARVVPETSETTTNLLFGSNVESLSRTEGCATTLSVSSGVVLSGAMPHNSSMIYDFAAYRK